MNMSARRFVAKAAMVALVRLDLPPGAPALSPLKRQATLGAVAEWGVAAVLILALALYAYLGRYARYLADDYATKVALGVRSFWAQQVAEYQRAGGRFAAEAAVDGAGLLNEFFVRLLPGLLLVLWVAAIAIAVKAVLPSIGRLASLIIAMGIVFTTLHITPSPFESLYWMTASLIYISPLILGTVFVALAASRHEPRRTTILAAGVVAFVAGGFNETYAALQLLMIGAALLATMVAVWPGLRRSRPLLISGCLGTLASLIAVGIAPGNAVRFRVVTGLLGTPRPSFVQLPGVAINFAMQFFNSVFFARWGALVTVGALVALISARTNPTVRMSARRGLPLVAYVAAVAIIAMVASFVPYAYVTGLMEGIYAQITPVFIGVCAVAVVGWSVGRYMRSLFGRQFATGRISQKWRPRIVAIAAVVTSCIVAATPVKSMATIWGERGAFHAYAATKDAQAALALAAATAGRPSVAVPPIPANLGLFSHQTILEMTSDPNWWINRDEAIYYGVGSITVHG
jgi:hypothetical protein